MNEASGARRLPPAALVVGVASSLAGLLLGALWLQQRLAPRLLQLPFVPFFDGVARWDRSPGLIAAHGLAALALIVAGGAILTRQRFAPWTFLVLGWGGLLFTLAAVWPGRNLRGKIDMLLTLGRDRGALPRDATLFSLVPTTYYVIATVALLAWLTLLVAGTRHVLKDRALYDR